MQHRFLDYLNDERDRLNQFVTVLTADGRDDEPNLCIYGG